LHELASRQNTVQVPTHRALQLFAPRHWAEELSPSTAAQSRTFTQRYMLFAPVSAWQMSVVLQLT
jgi:hypothetical protein